MISVKGLKKQFGDLLVWEGIDVEINKGDCVCIIGPSGCGKSTFLRCLNVLETPTAGQVFIDNEEITAKGAPVDKIRRKMGMVYQSFNLFSHKTVLENVIMAPMLLDKKDKKTAIAQGMRYLDMVGMTERADYMPAQLSGGQKQRAAIARCLAMEPEVILFDEPTSALDPTMVDEVLSVIRVLIKNGMTCVIVTHEMNFAKNAASQIFYMDDHGIYERGTPEEIFEHPTREKTKAFINRLKVFEYRKQVPDFDYYEFISMVSAYCRKYGFKNRQIHSIEVITEELLGYLKAGDKITKAGVRINYDDAKEQINMSFLYGAPMGKLTEMPDFDEISKRIITGFSSEIKYRETQEGNELEFRIL